MRKLFILTILLVPIVGVSAAQPADGRIRIDDVRIGDPGETLQVDFTVSIAPKAVKPNYSLVFAPVIVHDTFRQSLPPVVVQRGGTKIARQRREWIARRTESYPDAVYAVNGQTVSVTAVVPFQAWMYGANLVFETVEGGCCSYEKLADVLLAENIVTQPVTDPSAVADGTSSPSVTSSAADAAGAADAAKDGAASVAVAPSAATEWVPVTVADSLSTAFTFVVPFTEFDEDEPFKLYDDERENALVIYFRAGKLEIYPDYMDNEHTMTNLTAAVNMVMESRDSRVARIVVAGFSSPEGSFEVNDRLAFERAVSVKKYIMETTGATDRQVMIFNGSVDWRGLRAMIERSDLPEKQDVLSIIDHTPIWDSRRQVGRLGELMRLNGGQTYRYLHREYFPYLRNGAFIKVYYENR